MQSPATFALSCYKQLMRTPYEQIQSVGETVLIPKFNEKFISSLIDDTRKVLIKGSPVVSVFGNIYIIGDIHGNFFDLIRIFAKHGYPPMASYVFLGDYVDRGDMSLDVIQLLFILKASFPEHITLLRGNHEFAATNRNYGFYEQLMEQFGNDSLWQKFNECFEFLPFVAIVNEAFFCVHGGISEQMNGLKQLNIMKFPIEDNSLITDLVWSDPSPDVTSFAPNCRGKGAFYGACAVVNFLKDLDLKMIVRSHECVNGFKASLSNLVLTVFSCSYYTNSRNRAGYAFVDENAKIKCFVLDDVKRPERKNMCYYDAFQQTDNDLCLRPGYILKSKSKMSIFNVPGVQRHSTVRLLPQRHLPFFSAPSLGNLRACASKLEIKQ